MRRTAVSNRTQVYTSQTLLISASAGSLCAEHYAGSAKPPTLLNAAATPLMLVTGTQPEFELRKGLAVTYELGRSDFAEGSTFYE